MEVTKYNYEALYDSIIQSVESCDFLSIDGEFTGLHKEKRFDSNYYDTPEERYAKLFEGSLDFRLIQLGLCTFTYDEKLNRYEAKPYNFYVFANTSDNKDFTTFLCQTSSIGFLARQGFDFNKLFCEGIPYLSQQQQNESKEQIMVRNDLDDTLDTSAQFTSPENTPRHKGTPIPHEQRPFIKQICQKVDEFLKDENSKSMSLDPCTAFQRKLIYEEIKSKYSSSLTLQTKTNDKHQKYLEISLLETEEERTAHVLRVQTEKLTELTEMAGLSRLLRSISQSGKVVVGHNMIMDLIFIIHQFFLPLPSEYKDFKSLVHCIFPKLLDTKLMASTQPFKDLIQNTSLGHLYETVQKKPFDQPQVCSAEGFPVYTTNQQLHDAGYDAYITGVSLITLKHYLGRFQNNTHISVDSPLMQPFINKINLTNVCDVPYINLVNEDLKPSRDHVFHITFPQSWKSQEIQQLFAPYGNIRIAWLSNTSANVGLYQKSHVENVKKSLCPTDTGVFTITPLNEYKAKIKGSNERKRNSDDITEQLDAAMTPKRRKSTKTIGKSLVSESVVTSSKHTKNNLGISVPNDEMQCEEEPYDDEETKLFQEPNVW